MAFVVYGIIHKSRYAPVCRVHSYIHILDTMYPANTRILDCQVTCGPRTKRTEPPICVTNSPLTHGDHETIGRCDGLERRSVILRRAATAMVAMVSVGTGLNGGATAADAVLEDGPQTIVQFSGDLGEDDVSNVEATTSQQQATKTLSTGSALDGQGTLNVILSDQMESVEDDTLTVTQRQALQINRRTQRQNNAPPDFPLFVREGYDMTVLASSGYQVTDDGLIYKDYVVGSGREPRDGQQVTFDYTAYNESASVIDSSYRKGQPASTRLGIAGMIPGFEMGIKTMKPGGKRRIIVPPELGPPVGPSTFFSAKQFEVFDVELRSSKTCTRRTIGMFSDVVCADDLEDSK